MAVRAVETAAQQAQAERELIAARAAYKVRCDAEAARMEAERQAKEAAEAEARQARDMAAKEPYSEPRQYGGSAPAPPAVGQTLTMEATAYCDHGRTADDTPTAWGVVAAGPSFPFGTRMQIPGYGDAVVHDRGGAVHDGVVDLWMPSCAQAIEWGRRTVTVTIY